jgi:hypothetical protein
MRVEQGEPGSRPALVRASHAVCGDRACIVWLIARMSSVVIRSGSPCPARSSYEFGPTELGSLEKKAFASDDASSTRWLLSCG